MRNPCRVGIFGEYIASRFDTFSGDTDNACAYCGSQCSTAATRKRNIIPSSFDSRRKPVCLDFYLSLLGYIHTILNHGYVRDRIALFNILTCNAIIKNARIVVVKIYRGNYRRVLTNDIHGYVKAGELREHATCNTAVNDCKLLGAFAIVGNLRRTAIFERDIIRGVNVWLIDRRVRISTITLHALLTVGHRQALVAFYLIHPPFEFAFDFIGLVGVIHECPRQQHNLVLHCCLGFRLILNSRCSHRYRTHSKLLSLRGFLGYCVYRQGYVSVSLYAHSLSNVKGSHWVCSGCEIRVISCGVK